MAEASVQSSLDALHVHGGYGYMTEYQIERELRDAISAKIYSSTSEIQQMIQLLIRVVCENTENRRATNAAP